ncbi:MAG: FtsX-like permease family protein [Candidatus Dormiibacterota bacterium]
MQQLLLLLRAIWWRTAANTALLAVATLAIGAAAAGPLYLGTADDTVLHATLQAAGSGPDAITAGSPGESYTGENQAQAALRLESHYPVHRLYGSGVLTVDVGVLGGHGDLVARPGVCQHLNLIAGHCATKRGQVEATAYAANAVHARLGKLFQLPGASPPDTFLLVGLIGPDNYNAPYWMGDDFFSQGGGEIGTFFTPLSTVTGRLAADAAQFPLRISLTTPGNLQVLVNDVSAYDYAATTELGLTVTTGLFGTLDQYDLQATEMAAIVAVVDLELVLLTLLVLYSLVVRTAQARQREVALAKIHGFTWISVLMVGIGEPLAVLCIALPLGIGLAWLGVNLISPELLAGSPVLMFPLVVIAGLVGFGGGVFALVVAVRRILGGSLLDDVRGLEPRPRQAARAVWDGVAVALALAGLVELVGSGVLAAGRPNPVALFAPALLGTAVGVVGVRGLLLITRPAVRRTAGTRFVAVGLALRQVLRRASAVRQVLLMTVACTLICFAVETWLVAGTNRAIRADFREGAPRVLQVDTGPNLNLVDAVRAADPSGRYAMAVEELQSPGEDLLAVDARRLAAVAFWPPGVSRARVQGIARWLEGHLAPPLLLTGSAVRMTVAVTGTVEPPPDLQFDLLDNSNNAGVADFGYLRSGVHRYFSPLPASCVDGCRVESLTPYWSPQSGGPQAATYALTVSAIQVLSRSTWLNLGPLVYHPDYWQPGASGAEISRAPVGIEFGFHDAAGQDIVPSVVSAALPATLPGVATRSSRPPDSTTASVLDFDGTPLTIHTAFVVTSLPSLGANGYLIDLSTALRAENNPFSNAIEYVWLARQAPLKVVRALRRQGITIVAQSTPAAAIRSSDRQGVALAYQFFLFTAVAAAALAIATALLTVFLDARRRGYELAMLRVAAIDIRTLRRALVLEQLSVLLPGLLLGIAAGFMASRLALASIPEFVSSRGGPPLQLSLPIWPVAALALALATSLLLAAWVAAWGTLRMARFSVLRMDVG